MSADFDARSLLGFEKFITPVIIKILYWIGIVVMSLFAIVGVFRGLILMGDAFFMGLVSMFGAVIAYGFGLLFWRILMEVYIVFFGIHERLGEIRDRLGERAG